MVFGQMNLRDSDSRTALRLLNERQNVTVDEKVTCSAMIIAVIANLDFLSR